MDAATIQESLYASRDRLLSALEMLPDEAFSIPNAVGNWSVIDLLSHLIVWESELVTALLKLNQGKRPERYLSAIANIDQYNAKRTAEHAGRDLDQIFTDLHGVRAQLEQWVEEFSSKQLNAPKYYKWFKGRSLAAIIAETSYGHELKHAAALENFARSYAEAETLISPLNILVTGENNE